MTNKELRKLKRIFRILSNHPDFEEKILKVAGAGKWKKFLQSEIENIIKELESEKELVETSYFKQIEKAKNQIDCKIEEWR